MSAGGRDGYPDASARLTAVLRLFPGDVEGTDPLAGLQRLVVQKVRGDDPRDLELQAVGVLAVQALGRAVVGCANQGVRSGQGMCKPLQLVKGVDLPRQVVEAHGRS